MKKTKLEKEISKYQLNLVANQMSLLSLINRVTHHFAKVLLLFTTPLRTFSPTKLLRPVLLELVTTAPSAREAAPNEYMLTVLIQGR